MKKTFRVLPILLSQVLIITACSADETDSDNVASNDIELTGETLESPEQGLKSKLLEQLDSDNESMEATSVPLDVPLIQQMPELERGCEVTSLAMILQYHGIDIDKMELAENIAFEPFKENGLRGNMNQGFVGNIETFQESGLGVYVGPIIELAAQYFDQSKIINITGKSTDALYDAIDAGSPVWMLTNSWFSYLPEEQFATWQTAEGPMKVTYRQHSVVLTGYDVENVYINDPLQTEKNIALNRTDFEEAWTQMGSQAFYLFE